LEETLLPTGARLAFDVFGNAVIFFRTNGPATFSLSAIQRLAFRPCRLRRRTTCEDRGIFGTLFLKRGRSFGWVRLGPRAWQMHPSRRGRAPKTRSNKLAALSRDARYGNDSSFLRPVPLKGVSVRNARLTHNYEMPQELTVPRRNRDWPHYFHFSRGCAFSARNVQSFWLVSESLLTWNDVPGAVSYNVYRSDDTNTTWSLVASGLSVPRFRDRLVTISSLVLCRGRSQRRRRRHSRTAEHGGLR
jgi:hypothetical protein